MRLAVVLIVALVVGCATQYQPQGLSGGFSDTRLSENIFRVTFRGNGFTNTDRASDFALLRSAELMLQSGYGYFAIAGSDDRSGTGVYAMPGTANTTYYGNQSTTTIQPGAIIPIVKPGVALTIIGACQRSPEAPFDARFVQQSIRAKYGLRPASETIACK